MHVPYYVPISASCLHLHTNTYTRRGKASQSVCSACTCADKEHVQWKKERAVCCCSFIVQPMWGREETNIYCLAAVEKNWVYQPGHAVWKGLCTSGWTSLLYVSFHMNFHCLFSCLKFSFSFCLRIHNLSRIYRLETQLCFLFLPLPLPLSSSACWSKIVWE